MMRHAAPDARGAGMARSRVERKPPGAVRGTGGWTAGSGRCPGPSGSGRENRCPRRRGTGRTPRRPAGSSPAGLPAETGSPGGIPRHPPCASGPPAVPSRSCRTPRNSTSRAWSLLVRHRRSVPLAKERAAIRHWRCGWPRQRHRTLPRRGLAGAIAGDARPRDAGGRPRCRFRAGRAPPARPGGAGEEAAGTSRSRILHRGGRTPRRPSRPRVRRAAGDRGPMAGLPPPRRPRRRCPPCNAAGRHLWVASRRRGLPRSADDGQPARSRGLAGPRQRAG